MPIVVLCTCWISLRLSSSNRLTCRAAGSVPLHCRLHCPHAADGTLEKDHLMHKEEEACSKSTCRKVFLVPVVCTHFWKPFCWRLWTILVHKSSQVHVWVGSHVQLGDLLQKRWGRRDLIRFDTPNQCANLRFAELKVRESPSALLGSMFHLLLVKITELSVAIEMVCIQGTGNGVEQMVSKAHQSASGRIAMHQLCFALQSLFLQKKHAYTCIFGPAGPECRPASHHQEENRRRASSRSSGASRRITIHPRYHLFYNLFVSSMYFLKVLLRVWMSGASLSGDSLDDFDCPGQRFGHDLKIWILGLGVSRLIHPLSCYRSKSCQRSNDHHFFLLARYSQLWCLGRSCLAWSTTPWPR